MREVLKETEDFRCSLEMWGGFPLLHFGVFKFSKSIYKQWKNNWPGVLETLRLRGFTKIYATPFEGDLRAKKLIEHFGFKLIRTVRGVHLMRRSI
tara:strand:- start:2024 stop:2308 length:285 start_codon:yes stop_codon:yes gene_type:complete